MSPPGRRGDHGLGDGQRDEQWHRQPVEQYIMSKAITRVMRG